MPLRATVAAVLLAASLANGAAAADGHRSIVVLRDGADPEAFVRAHGVAPDHVYRHTVKGFAAHLGAGQAAKLAAHADVRYVVADRLLSLPKPVVAQGKGGGAVPPPSQSTPDGVKRIGGLASGGAKIDGIDDAMDVDIAIVDTGIDLAHPDLDVSNGRQKTFVARTSSARDDNGHGTHCAGSAAAIDNGIGVVGVAPGARLWAVKVLDRRGSGWLGDIAAGIDWASDPARGIEVISLSLGATSVPGPDLMRDAVLRAIARGVVVTVAAGNESDDAMNHTPANVAEAITVSAIVDTNGLGGGGGASTSSGADDTFASFSNFGVRVDIAAPGVSIHSTYPGGYARMSGTSMACPHVAGAAALLIARNRPAGTGTAFVAAVRDQLVGTGAAQGTALGFTGDPDQQGPGALPAQAEPLLRIDWIAPPVQTVGG